MRSLGQIGPVKYRRQSDERSVTGVRWWTKATSGPGSPVASGTRQLAVRLSAVGYVLNYERHCRSLTRGGE